jgi:hypothetical protein
MEQPKGKRATNRVSPLAREIALLLGQYLVLFVLAALYAHQRYPDFPLLPVALTIGAALMAAINIVRSFRAIGPLLPKKKRSPRRSEHDEGEGDGLRG